MSEKYEIVLLEPWGGSNIGDIAVVGRGIYNTLINLKKGLPIGCYDSEATDKQKLVITIKNLEEDNKEVREYSSKLYDENEKLKKKLEKLSERSSSDKNSCGYKNKMMTTSE